VDTNGKTDKLFMPPRLIKQIKKLAKEKKNGIFLQENLGC